MKVWKHHYVQVWLKYSRSPIVWSHALLMLRLVLVHCMYICVILIGVHDCDKLPNFTTNYTTIIARCTGNLFLVWARKYMCSGCVIYVCSVFLYAPIYIILHLNTLHISQHTYMCTCGNFSRPSHWRRTYHRIGYFRRNQLSPLICLKLEILWVCIVTTV